MAIRFTYDNKNYILEFTRRTVSEMEKSGFDISELFSKPVTRMPEIFAGAFKAHHRNESPETIRKIFETMPNKLGKGVNGLKEDESLTEEQAKEAMKDSLIGKLYVLYHEPLNTLLSEPDEKKETVTVWEAD